MPFFKIIDSDTENFEAKSDDVLSCSPLGEVIASRERILFASSSKLPYCYPQLPRSSNDYLRTECFCAIGQ